MSSKTQVWLATGFLFVLALGMLGCRPERDSAKPIDWTVSWTPPIAHEDNTPLISPPVYELEMANGGSGEDPWKVVWSGSTTTAVFKAPPGRHCFRAVTVENGVRSRPSEVNCATNPATGDLGALKEEDSQR